MKILLTLILSFACTHNSSPKLTQDHSKKQSNKFDYLQEFYKLRDDLKLQSKQCQTVTTNVLKKLYKDSKDSLGFELVNAKAAAKVYDLKNYDWILKNQLQELYLNYQFNAEIVAEHFEISHNIPDCQNEFDHLNFLKAAVVSYKIKSNRPAVEKIINKYLIYMLNNPTSPLNTVILAETTQMFKNAGIIKFSNDEQYNLEKEKLKSFFTDAGKNTLIYFREKNYQMVYETALGLQKQKEQFIHFLKSTITLP